MPGMPLHAMAMKRGTTSWVTWLSAISVSSVAVIYSIKYFVSVLLYDRCALVRCHPWKWVRRLYQRWAVYDFAWRVSDDFVSFEFISHSFLLPLFQLERAVKNLPDPEDALDLHPNSNDILDEILGEAADRNIHTFQKRPKNRIQIKSLMKIVCDLVLEVQTQRPTADHNVKCNPFTSTGNVTPTVLDIGAGKALLTRGIFEALEGQVETIAMDCRAPGKTDQMYDPSSFMFTRIVGDVKCLGVSISTVLDCDSHSSDEESRRGLIAVTKHLCGGATDASLMALCSPPLDSWMSALCFAPCCHQKLKRTQYCNMAFIEAIGLCKTHIGVQGKIQDVDWKNIRMLISMSKGGLRDGVTEGGEYKNSQMLQFLGKKRACELGRMARRLLEEGRMQYLQRHGYDTKLVKYCDERVTGDNWAIIAKKKRT